MKKPHVLNRAMFNRGGTSAYGRGITSNLVSDEQRQRFNYGGRVGFQPDNPIRYVDWSDAWTDYIKPGWDKFSETMRIGSGIPAFLEEGDVLGQNTEGEDILYEDPLADAKRLHVQKKAREKSLEPGDKFATAKRLLTSDDAFNQQPIVDPSKKTTTLPADPASDVIDWETFAEGLYDKKGAKGKAQLELAGNVLAAAFQPKKEAMAILGKGVGQFGKTVSGRKEKMEDIAATGKMYETIYKTREEEKGKQRRMDAAEKANLLKTGTPSEKYMAHITGEELKPKVIRDAIYRASGSKIIPKMMPGTPEDADKERADPKNEGKIYIQDQQTFILKNGEFEIIDLDAIFETLKP